MVKLMWLGLALLTLTCAAAAQPAADREAARNHVSAAVQRKDYPAAIAAAVAWARQHPTDLRFRKIEPLLYRLAGNEPGWEASRANLMGTWRTRTGVPESMDSSFTIDRLTAGAVRIVAEQCYEQAGRFGVSYRLNVIGADNRIGSYFTVESPPSENQMRREMGLPSPSFTLDYFVPGRHETVALLPGAPVYADVRQRALDYLANPKPVSGSNTGTGLANVGCEVGGG